MTAEELDEIAEKLSRETGTTETARARIRPAVSFLKSDPAAFASFSEMAGALRDICDMKRLLGTENEMFQEIAWPASKLGTDAFKSLAARIRDKDVLIALSDIAMSYANRGRKPKKPKRTMKA